MERQPVHRCCRRLGAGGSVRTRIASIRTDKGNMHGLINVNSSAGNTDDLIDELKQSLRGRAYAMAANSGQA